MPSLTRARLAVAAFLLVIPLLFFYRSLLLGEAFLPADLLRHLFPWRAAVAPPPPDAPSWNVLRFDGITQFYPWRLQAWRSYHAGQIPLWNPYQFADQGGTPLLANSQSAPLYPLNLVFWLMPAGRLWYAFGLAAAVHMGIAAAGVYMLLRRAARVRRPAALLGAVTYAFSGPVVTWLALPTFLAVSCWIPWLLLLVRYAHDGAGARAGRLAAAGAGGVAGTMLLAGHLQMAFYGMLAAGLYALHLGITGLTAGSVRPARWLLGVLGAAALALMLALPQLLPAVELSRQSHRVVTLSSTLYQGYIHLALPPRNLVTLLVPDFFGHPNSGLYWNDSDRGGNNYAEWAVYVGVLPLLLALFAAALPWRGEAGRSLPGERAFFTILGALSLLLATGTPVNLILFWGVPGYAQTGNPARSLILFALSASVLAGIGLDALLHSAEANAPLSRASLRRAGLVALCLPVLAAAFGAAQGAEFARAVVPNAPLAALLGQAMPGVLLALVLLGLAAGLLFGLPRLAVSPSGRRVAGGLCIALGAADLWLWGAGYNPTVSSELVYPETPGLALLRERAGEGLVAPIGVEWTLGGIPPRDVVLPPNSLTVYGLRGLGGYDSLFPGVYKERVREAGGGLEPSPPANGNMVFIQNVETALALGARYLVTPPLDLGGAPSRAAARLTSGEFPALQQIYAGPDMMIYENPEGVSAPTVRPAAPASFRIGLFAGFCAVSALAAAGLGTAFSRRRPSHPQRETPAPASAPLG